MYFMKTNGTQKNLLGFVLLFIVLLTSLPVLAQRRPDYVFKNARRVSASSTDKRVGGKYLFSNVKSGVDAFVTITDIKNVTLSELDGNDGYDDAFQPVIKAPARTKGYVEFRFDFVLHNTVIPAIMLEVPVTAIDIDGNTNRSDKAYEFDEFDVNLVSHLLDFNLVGSSLDVLIGRTEVAAKNKTGTDYPGIDTTKKDAMFTMVYSAVTSITIRTGVDNQTNGSVERLRSDYFLKFDYGSSFLAKPSLNTFRGFEKNSKVNLQWELNNDNALSTVVIEKATTANKFQAIGEVWVNTDGVKQKNFQYADNASLSGQAYYRLKMVAVNGKVEYSNILAFRSADVASEKFRVYPSVIQSSATVNVRAEKSSPATFQVVDYSGRVVMQKNINMQEGDNNIVLNNLQNLNPGNYVAVVKTSDNKMYNQKIVKQ